MRDFYLDNSIIPHWNALSKYRCMQTRDKQWLSRESWSQGSLQIFESQYQSTYQDCNSKSLDSSLDIKTQDLRVLNPFSMSRLKIWESWFQSWYQYYTFKSLNSSSTYKLSTLHFWCSLLIFIPSDSSWWADEQSCWCLWKIQMCKFVIINFFKWSWHPRHRWLGGQVKLTLCRLAPGY